MSTVCVNQCSDLKNARSFKFLPEIALDLSIHYVSIVTVLLLHTGTLQSVTNLSRNGSIISWSPPFSLNLTNIEPDIVYCVEVYNITCRRRDLSISDCSVTEPSYTSYDLVDGYIYEYIVTPRSNVSEARNGTQSQPFRGMSGLFHNISATVVLKIWPF